MKRIAIVTNTFPKVSETFIYRKVHSLLQNGYTITVITHGKSNDWKYFDSIESRYFSVYSVAKYGQIEALIKFLLKLMLSKPFFFIKNIVNVSKKKTLSVKEKIQLFIILMAGPFDNIHFEYSGIALQYIKILPFLKPALISVSCRGTAELILPIVEPDRKKMLNELFSKVEKVHCVSKHMAINCQQYGLAKEKTTVIHPAIDINVFKYLFKDYPSVGEPLKIISVGRLTWIKGLDLALAALKICNEKGLNFEFSIIGEGEDEAHLKYLTKLYQLRGKVKFLGKFGSIEVLTKLEEHHVFLLSSFSEGISNAVLEAMACGKCVVSTKAGGMEEVITSGYDGLLCDIGDANSISQALLNIGSGQYNYKSICYNARKTIENKFDLIDQLRHFSNFFS